MNPRLLVLILLLAVAAGGAYWRRKLPRTPSALKEEQAELAARRFLRLREAETAADRTTWAPAEAASRIEAALAIRVQAATESRDLEKLGPGIGSFPASSGGLPLVWLKADLLSVQSPSATASKGEWMARIRGEAVFQGLRPDGTAGATVVERFLGDAVWVDRPAPEWTAFRLIRHQRSESAGPAFRVWADLVIPTNGVGQFVDPLILENRPGGERLLLAGAGLAAVRQGDLWKLEPADFGSPERILAAAVVDIDGDGEAEWLVADSTGLRRKTPSGWNRLWLAPARLRHPQSLTVGDVDGDGRPDVWLTQYKAPYAGGQFPTPYFDALDGFPSYLLRNEGERFVDATEASGLSGKRLRRTYSASWVDLDGDGDLDLVNVSDFAGVDLHLNDGHGRFLEATGSLGESRHLFGMAHAMMDFNGDSLPDLLAIGMDSPVASQLDSQGLGRPEFPQHTAKRPAMTFGNRVFLGTGHPGSYRMEFSSRWESLRWGGWAWGVAVADWNNDGQEDVYLANGHETLENRADFERQFWLHDIYAGASTNDPAVLLYYTQAAERRHAARMSYGGWQANRLFTADGKGDFVEEGWLRGVAMTEDSRNVVSGDFDRDGRIDLAVTTYEQWPEVRQRLRIFHNETTDAGKWIGFRLPRHVPGSRVEVTTSKGLIRRWCVTGDGYRSQSGKDVHVGLGSADVVRAEWIWPDGKRVPLPGQSGRWN